MLQTARWGGMAHGRGLILAGSAAGIAAAFNTPLARPLILPRPGRCRPRRRHRRSGFGRRGRRASYNFV